MSHHATPLKFLMPGWFAIVMGLCGLSLAWHRAVPLMGEMAGAGALLPPGAPLLLYGPFIEPGVATADSNCAFDADLRARDARWGLRDTAALDALAGAVGLARTARHAMPANNLLLVWRKA